MDRKEALAVLQERLSAYRKRSYFELQKLIGQPETLYVDGPSGIRYQLEFEAFWDANPNGNLRIVGSIDDMTLIGSIAPLSDDFIVSPQGRFVGE